MEVSLENLYLDIGAWRVKSNRYFFIFPIFTMAIEMGEGPGQTDKPLPPNF